MNNIFVLKLRGKFIPMFYSRVNFFFLTFFLSYIPAFLLFYDTIATILYCIACLFLYNNIAVHDTLFSHRCSLGFSSQFLKEVPAMGKVKQKVVLL